MTHGFKNAFSAAFVAVCLALGANAQTVGVAVSVLPESTLSRAGKTSALSDGQSLLPGDVIATGRRGQVQIVFEDETRIAVGPNASLSIDDIRMRQNGTARKFAVSAVAGGFRFLSGTSPKSAYSITTPTATMGIRGTSFDFVVRRREATDLIIFEGLVHMCGSSGTCFRIAGECAAVRMDTRGTARKFSEGRSRRGMITDGFQFMTQPQKLSRDFRTNLRSCGRDAVAQPISRGGEERARPEPPQGPILK